MRAICQQLIQNLRVERFAVGRRTVFRHRVTVANRNLLAFLRLDLSRFARVVFGIARFHFVKIFIEFQVLQNRVFHQLHIFARAVNAGLRQNARAFIVVRNLRATRHGEVIENVFQIFNRLRFVQLHPFFDDVAKEIVMHAFINRNKAQRADKCPIFLLRRDFFQVTIIPECGEFLNHGVANHLARMIERQFPFGFQKFLLELFALFFAAVS